MMNIRQIVDTIASSNSLSYNIYNSMNLIEITIEDFEGFTDDWDESIVDVDEEEVRWAESLDGTTVDGWRITVQWASEDI
jgi:hypothetical protein